jgi:hypothetical protein
LPRDWIDPFSSAPHFDGYKPLAATSAAERWAIRPPITALPRTWLLRTGWRLRGLLDREAVPGLRRVPRRDGSYRIEVR